MVQLELCWLCASTHLNHSWWCEHNSAACERCSQTHRCSRRKPGEGGAASLKITNSNVVSKRGNYTCEELGQAESDDLSKRQQCHLSTLDGGMNDVYTVHFTSSTRALPLFSPMCKKLSAFQMGWRCRRRGTLLCSRTQKGVLRSRGCRTLPFPRNSHIFHSRRIGF